MKTIAPMQRQKPSAMRNYAKQIRELETSRTNEGKSISGLQEMAQAFERLAKR